MVQLFRMKKRTTDGRKLSHEALEQLRKVAVQRVQNGESPEEVIRSLGFARSCIYEWLAAYRSGGWDALRAKKLFGRPKKLGGKQIQWLYRAITNGNPQNYRFEFALWTRQIIADLIKRQFGIKLSLASVGRLLAQLGLTCQRPLFRAWQQDQKLVDQWLGRDFPKLQARAKREGAKIYFADEAGIRSDFHAGTTWAESGQTPVIKVTGARFGLNMVSAISPRGELRFMVVDGTVDAAVFVQFLKRLVQDSREKVFLVVDGHPTHRSRKAKDFVESTRGKLELIFLPPYSPELNPDELVWNNLKSQRVGRKAIQSKEQLKREVIGGLRSLQKDPTKVKSFFGETNTKYASEAA
jgi:transposase